jgi:Ca2+:H+ antiporter
LNSKRTIRKSRKAKQTTSLPWWTWVSPLLALVILVFFLTSRAGAGPVVAIVAGAALVATVFVAVFHAETIANKVGEPFGTLILALAVTIIEVSLIVFVMIGAEADKSALARDTVFAVVMIVCNGIVGLCLLLGGVRHHEQGFQVQGASAALAVLAALTTLTLVVPNLTSTAGPFFSPPQLIFAGVISLVLYGCFVFVQTVRHRDYFLPVGKTAEAHAPPPSDRVALVSCGLLLISLVAVVGLAKVLTPSVESFVDTVGAPKLVVGIIIATLVLLPESVAALRAAAANRLQTSLNLALGSALASIGLTIPAVAVISIAMNYPLELGLDLKEQTFLAITLLVGVITLGTGRTTVMQGLVHLVIFAAFLFLAVVP